MKKLLQVEYGVLFVGTSVLYMSMGYSWILFLVLFFVPDSSILFYAINNKVGAIIYNIFHSVILPVTIIILVILTKNQTIQNIMPVMIIMLAHSFFDRMCGFGLKKYSGFKDTSMGSM